VRLKLAIILAFTAVAACSARYVGNENSPHYVVPAGSQLELNRPLDIPGGAVSVFIQDGRIMPLAQLDRYSPYCKFELYTLDPNPRTVNPDEIAILRAQQTIEFGLFAAAGHSARGIFGAMMGDKPGGSPLQTFMTRMQLRSATQPDIYRLTCAEQAFPPEGEHVSIAEMRRTLGDLFTLTIDSSAAPTTK
jgi:hypothetical protein